MQGNYASFGGVTARARGCASGVEEVGYVRLVRLGSLLRVRCVCVCSSRVQLLLQELSLSLLLLAAAGGASTSSTAAFLASYVWCRTHTNPCCVTRGHASLCLGPVMDPRPLPTVWHWITCAPVRAVFI